MHGFMQDRLKERKMIKDRDEAWSRVEELAMQQPDFIQGFGDMVISNNTNSIPQHAGSPPNEDTEVDQSPHLVLEKIEAKANEVSPFTHKWFNHALSNYKTITVLSIFLLLFKNRRIFANLNHAKFPNL